MTLERGDPIHIRIGKNGRVQEAVYYGRFHTRLPNAPKLIVATINGDTVVCGPAYNASIDGRGFTLFGMNAPKVIRVSARIVCVSAIRDAREPANDA